MFSVKELAEPANLVSVLQFQLLVESSRCRRNHLELDQCLVVLAGWEAPTSST